MKTGTLAAVLALLILGNLKSSPQVRPACDCYDPNAVRSWVELPAGFAEGSSFLEKGIYRGGDLVATGIVQALSQQELLDRSRLDRVLSLVRLSFSQPKFITCPDSRNPRVTLLLLYFLKHEFRDEETRNKIIATEQYVSAQAEHNAQSN